MSAVNMPRAAPNSVTGRLVTPPGAGKGSRGAKLPTIGVLGANTRPIDSQRIAALVQRLRELATV